ncbi:MAG: sigma-54-dependent Fis family transcriptional regulator [Planctomycetes bacterium]|nr:sigma-54-dependent Fis family transcriptional regulator [Planctomycetota bacterium]
MGKPVSTSRDGRTETPSMVLDGRIARIIETARDVRRQDRPDDRYRTVLAGALDLVHADRAFLALGGPGERAKMGVVAGWTEDGEAIPDPEFYVDHALLRRACENDGAIVSTASHVGGDSEGHGTKSRSALVVGRRLSEAGAAVLYLDRSASRAPFVQEDRERAEAYAEEVFLELERIALRDIALERRRILESSPAPSPAREEEEIADAGARGGEIPGYAGIIGKSEKIRRVFEIIEKVRDADLNIFIHGESGTGKELVARAIHTSGKRRERPFLSENCGSIPENLLESELFGHVKGAFTGADSDKKGILELADGGTLFLDEISDMSQGMQTKLLRVLQEGCVRPVGGKETRPIDVRIVTASHRDLETLVRTGRFRMDLYYRLNVIAIPIPPLRERREDIPLMVEGFLRELAAEDGVERRVAPAALRLLAAHSWPGNVRELKNVIRRASLTASGKTIARKDVRPLLAEGGASPFGGERLKRVEGEIVLRIPARESFNDLIAECERLIIESALESMRWNKSKVTKALRIPRQSLYNKMERYGIKRSGD